jgi:hypothetical protein
MSVRCQSDSAPRKVASEVSRGASPRGSEHTFPFLELVELEADKHGNIHTGSAYPPVGEEQRNIWSTLGFTTNESYDSMEPLEVPNCTCI